MKQVALLALSALAGALAFAPTATRPVPRHLAARAKPSNSAPEDESDQPPKLSWDSLKDLIMMGAGAPNLGKFTGVDEDTGTLNFELDANRFIAKNGKEYGSFDNSDATYFEEGWVDDDADVMGKFFGGGKKKAASGGKAGEDKAAGFKWPWE